MALIVRHGAKMAPERFGDIERIEGREITCALCRCRWRVEKSDQAHVEWHQSLGIVYVVSCPECGQPKGVVEQ